MKRTLSSFSVGILLAVTALAASDAMAGPQQSVTSSSRSPVPVPAGIATSSNQDLLVRTFVQAWSNPSSAIESVWGPGLVRSSDPLAAGTLWSSSTQQLQGLLMVQNLGDTGVQLRTGSGSILLEVPAGSSGTLGGDVTSIAAPGDTVEYLGLGGGSELCLVWRVAR